MTNVDLTYRELASTDNGLYAVAPMHYRAWQDCYAEIIPEVDRKKTNGFAFVDAYKAFIDQAHHSLLMAEHEGSVVGMSMYYVAEGQGWIEALYLDVDSKHHGYGKALLAEVLTRMDADVTALDCAVANTEGQAFWKRNGFHRVGEGTPYQMDMDMTPVPTDRYQRDREQH